VLHELLHGAVIDVGQQAVFEERVDPLVQGVLTVINRRLFEWIAFTVGEGFEPDFPPLSDGDGRGCFDEGLRGVNAELFELFCSWPTNRTQPCLPFPKTRF
jgi:hypothetical protein